MKMKSESPKAFSFNPAKLIFSTIWGLNAAPKTGATGQRREIASLYAAYSPLLAR
jgi:hypothetical protein